ncbi:unnamed protein product, partial [Prunus brigantina]
PQDSSRVLRNSGQVLLQTLERRPRTYCRGMENARRREPRAPSSSQSNSQVIALTTEMAELQTQLSSYSTQMSQLLEFLAQSGIPILHFGPSSTFEPLQPEHGDHTSTPAENVQTSEHH